MRPDSSLPSLRPLRLATVLAAIAALAALAACASGGSSSSDGSATQAVGAPDGRRSSEILTHADIERAGVPTAYDAVQRLRPTWLRTRSSGSIQTSPQYAVVYLDGAQIGGPESLRRISANDVQSIRYLRTADATTRYGTGHEGGAILVETRK
jgi:hypothetical protein